MWVNHLVRKGDRISGILADEPELLPALHLGSPVEIAEADIADWTYRKNGKRWGHFSTRVLLQRTSAAEAAPILAVLSPTPLEPGTR
jgi:uncharacterized protein YegJ (DUF2314 family)